MVNALLLLAGFILGVLLAGRVEKAVRDAETSIHDRIRKLEETIKGKL